MEAAICQPRVLVITGLFDDQIIIWFGSTLSLFRTPTNNRVKLMTINIELRTVVQEMRKTRKIKLSTKKPQISVIRGEEAKTSYLV